MCEVNLWGGPVGSNFKDKTCIINGLFRSLVDHSDHGGCECPSQEGALGRQFIGPLVARAEDGRLAGLIEAAILERSQSSVSF